MSNKGMKYHSSPLRGSKEINEFINALKIYSNRNKESKKDYQRNYVLFMLGINTGLRMGDIVELKVKDVNKPINEIIENKTGKARQLAFNDKLKQLINGYIKDNNLSNDDWLFPSRQSKNSKGHVTQSTIYKLFKAVGVSMGRNDITCHSLRRTFGYNYYKQTKDINMLQRLFNHSSVAITRRYIGITKEEEQQAMENFTLGF